MNIFQTIRELVEKETGLECVLNTRTIEDNQIELEINRVEKTGHEGQYKVKGTLGIKTGSCMGWDNLKSVLDLNITDSQAKTSLKMLGDGFFLMTVNFSLVLKEEEKRKKIINRMNLRCINYGN